MHGSGGSSPSRCGSPSWSPADGSARRVIPTRWVVLAAGTFAQATYSAIWFGVAVMAPSLRDELHLSLGQTGVLISASLAGSVVSLIPWGLATDRFGERWVLLAGVGGCGARSARRRPDARLRALLLLLVLAGFLGASVQSASGRAVMAWFPALAARARARRSGRPRSRSAGFAASLSLAGDRRAAGASAGDSRRWDSRASSPRRSAALVDRATFRRRPVATRPTSRRCATGASGGSRSAARSCVAPQMCVVGFTVLLLHDHRGLSPGRAAAVLAVVQALGIGGAHQPPGAGRTSRAAAFGPLRAIALAVAVLVTACGSRCSTAPLVVLLPAARRRRRAVDELERPLVRGCGRARRPSPERRGDRAAAVAPERDRRDLPGPLRRARRCDVVGCGFARRRRASRSLGLARPASIARVSTRASSASTRSTRSPSTARVLGRGGRRARARRRLDARRRARGHARRRRQPVRVAR